jgi:transcriptional regulator with XRE-family HTH domain
MPRTLRPSLRRRARRARFLRKYLRVTQLVLGERMGIARETVVDWERGENAISAQHDLMLRAIVVAELMGAPGRAPKRREVVEAISAVRVADPPTGAPSPVVIDSFLPRLSAGAIRGGPARSPKPRETRIKTESKLPNPDRAGQKHLAVNLLHGGTNHECSSDGSVVGQLPVPSPSRRTGHGEAPSRLDRGGVGLVGRVGVLEREHHRQQRDQHLLDRRGLPGADRGQCDVRGA